MRDLYDEELRALLAFRQRHGRCWKAALLLCWSAGTDTDEMGSAHLRHLRNIGGPRWLIGLPAATLDDAARRFAGDVDPALIDIFMENATGFARGASASVGKRRDRSGERCAFAGHRDRTQPQSLSDEGGLCRRLEPCPNSA